MIRMTGMLTCGLLSAVLCLGASSASPPPLRVSDNGHFLVAQDGAPFFWLGDTAWSLTKLSKEEIRLYLADRASKGFTVIQVTGGFNEDFMGFRESPFLDDDTDRPRESYWRHVDFIVDEAARQGLYVDLVVMWGQAYKQAFDGDAEKARRLGLWLGTRYRDRSNVIWVVSGEYDSINDYDPTLSDEQRALFVAMAKGLRTGYGGRQLMSIHPGILRTSAVEFHLEPWLDFNMLQSGHLDDSQAWPCHWPEGPCAEAYDLVTVEYDRKPAKPVIDAEPAYDTKPDGFYLGTPGPRVGEDVMRRKAYWAVFAGAFGHVYGHNDIEIFYVPGEPTSNGQSGHWQEALEAPAAGQLQHLRRLVESRPMLTRVPDQSLLVSEPQGGIHHVRATRSSDGAYALIYIPTGGSVIVNLERLAAPGTVSWFDPRTGQSTPIGEFLNTETREFDAPGEVRSGNDWVLVLDAVPAQPANGKGE
jgi:hypothetical protein